MLIALALGGSEASGKVRATRRPLRASRLCQEAGHATYERVQILSVDDLAFRFHLPKRQCVWKVPLEIRDGRDDLVANDFEWRDPVYVRNKADYSLDAHAGKPTQLPDQLTCFRATLADD